MLAGKRGPLIVGAAAAVVAVLLVFFLVLPKMGQVSDSQEALQAARLEQGSLESQLQALEQAQAEAPEARKTIEDVDRKIPPTADLPGLILLLNNAATRASVTLLTITPSLPRRSCPEDPGRTPARHSRPACRAPSCRWR